MHEWIRIMIKPYLYNKTHRSSPMASIPLDYGAEAPKSEQLSRKYNKTGLLNEK